MTRAGVPRKTRKAAAPPAATPVPVPVAVQPDTAVTLPPPIAMPAQVAAPWSTPPYERSVYINCPFDEDFTRSMDAIIFTIICCGLQPRAAIETEDDDIPRMTRIFEAMRGSRCSIHDLSRIYPEKETKVARMNMPLELGIAMAMKTMRRNDPNELRHDWTALVPAGTPYTKAISDLNGHDLRRYSDTPGLISQVLSWLSMRVQGLDIAFEPYDVNQALPRFNEALDARRLKWPGVRFPWPRLVELGRSIAHAHKLRPQPGP